jgi:hypothetical protein
MSSCDKGPYPTVWQAKCALRAIHGAAEAVA